MADKDTWRNPKSKIKNTITIYCYEQHKNKDVNFSYWENTTCEAHPHSSKEMFKTT